MWHLFGPDDPFECETIKEVTITPSQPKRKYGGLTPDERTLARTERLIEVGTDLFAEKGFAKTGVRELCRGAKISEQAFYQSVKSRENLLSLVYMDANQKIIAVIIDSLVGSKPDMESRLRAGLGGFFKAINDDPRLGSIIYVESLGRAAEIEATRRKGLNQFVLLIRHELEQYLVDDDSAKPAEITIEVAISAMLTGIAEIAYRQAMGERRFSTEEAVDRLTVALIAMANAFGLKAGLHSVWKFQQFKVAHSTNCS